MRIKKSIKSIISAALIIFFLAAAGVVLKNIILRQIKREIQSSFEYSRLHFSFFPPLLVLEEAKTHSLSPFFSAEKISVRIPYKSLLIKEKPLNVLIEHPVLRLYEKPERREKAERKSLKLSFPFLVEEGEIKEGEFYFQGKDVSFQSKGIEANFAQRKDKFFLKAEAGESAFSASFIQKELKGKLSFFAESRGSEISLKNIKMEGSDYTIEAEEGLLNVSSLELLLKTSFRTKAPFIVEMLGIPFDWKGEAEGKGTMTWSSQGAAYKGKFSSGTLIFNKVPMGKVEGSLDISQKNGQTVEFNIQKKSLPQEYARIQVKGEKIEGTVRGFYLDPIMNYVSLPWPVSSPVWGSFAIDKGILEADVEFRDEDFRVEPGRFPFRGKVKLNWDGKGEVSFSSQDLFSSFARVKVTGKVNYAAQNVDFDIKGEVIDLIQGRQFTSLILGKDFPFPEIRGKGRAGLRIFGDYDYPQVQASFSLVPGGFAKFNVQSARGEFEVIKSDFHGEFDIDDPFLEGEIGLISNQQGVKADIHLARGFVEKIFPPLDIDFPLRGEGSGDFEVRQEAEDVQVKGSFSASRLELSGQSLTDVSGKLEWQKGTLSFPELQFRLDEGEISGRALVKPSTQEFEIDALGEGINLSLLYPDVKGSLRFGLKGKGFFGKDKAEGPFEIKDLYYSPFQKIEAKGEAKLGYSEGRFSLELNGNFFPGDNGFNVSLILPVSEEAISADIRGSFENLNLFLPWKGAKGRINYLAEVRGTRTSPQLKGAIDFQGTVFPLPKFAHAFRDFSVLMFVDNNRVTLRSLQAKLGGGDIQGSGELLIGKGTVEEINVKFEGKNLLLSPLERTRALADGTVNLIKGPERFLLEGNFLVQKLSWKREINEKFIYYSSPYHESQKEPGFFNDLNLNIRLKADGNAWMENSLGRVKGRFDLTVTGNVNAPVVMGEIEVLDGNVYFQDRKFKVLRGQLSFSNPLAVEPYISFKGETYVKNYRVTFSLEGPLDRLNPEFSSSPPLPPEDVLALLALGESFSRTYSYDTSTQLSTASLLSFQLSEEAKKRAEGLFVLDRFRIDPFVMGSSAEMTARLTVGKKMSRNFFILYSTNLTSQRDEIARLEWELTDDFSIVGTRDEIGRISFDVKVHKRF